MNSQKFTTRSNRSFFHVNNIISILFFIFIILILFNSCHDTREVSGSHIQKYTDGKYLQLSVKMADSQMERLGTSLMIGGSDPKAKWRYTTGLFLKSLLDLWNVTNDRKYLDYVKLTIDSFIQPDGSINKYKMSDYNLDKINSGKVLLQLFNITKEDKYKFASDTLREQLRKQPRTSEGGFWHKKRYPWQMWLDGIYMNTPFYAEYAKMFSETDGFSDVATQITLIDQKTRDPKTGLRYHAWDESNKQAWADPITGCSPHFWGRAMGWYMMALVDVLDYIPNNQEQRKQILYILEDVSKAVKKYQDDSGLWFQILDQGEREGNYLETSCSSMFVYAFAKASNKGYLGEEYHGPAFNGYNGLVNHMIQEDPDEKVNLENICGVAGLGGDPYRDGSFEYYINEPIVANDLKGVGPFIMAGLQIALLQEKSVKK